jgi:hypothetical protein
MIPSFVVTVDKFVNKKKSRFQEVWAIDVAEQGL